MKNKRNLVIWKSKTTLDYYRVLWIKGIGFVAYYQDRESEWVSVDASYTFEQVIEWIQSGDIEKDELIT